jgi:hypothetical protein
MSSINPAVRHCVSEFLKSIDDIKLGEREPDDVYEWRKMMAISVVAFVVHGDQEHLDLGDMAVSELAGATMAHCENPLNHAAIDAVVSAEERFWEIHRRLA